MNRLIKIYESRSQGVREKEDQVWCAWIDDNTDRTLCGDSFDDQNIIKSALKDVERGGITCPLCLDIIRQIKAIRL